jgi:hypothetical protein
VRALLVAIGLLAAACDTRVGADPARIFLLDRLRIDRVEAEAAIATRQNPSFPCAAIVTTIASFIDDKGEYQRVAPGTRAELDSARKLCSDGAYRYAVMQVAKLDAARREREDLVEECFDLEHALDLLARPVLGRARDPAVLALAARRKALCP